MDSAEQYAKWAHACVDSASEIDERDDRAEVRVEYWQREAQVMATLAVAAALHELRTMLVRDNDPDAGAFIRVAGRITTER
jgi:hypothetical protein